MKCSGPRGTGTPPNQSSGTAPHFGGADLKACGREHKASGMPGAPRQAISTSSQLVSQSPACASPGRGPPVPHDIVGPGSCPDAPRRTRAASGPRPALGRPQRPRGARAGPRPPQPRVGHRCPFKKGEGAREGMRRRRWPSAALPVRAEPSPRGGGSPGTDRQREGGRLTRRRKTAPANMALWRAPAGARSRRPPTPRGRPPSRARPRAATRGRAKPPR